MVVPGDLVVLNSTRVRHARLLGTRPMGGPAVLLIHPGADDTWIAMGSPGRAMQPGKRITLGPGAFVETLEVLDSGLRRIRFVGATAAQAIARFGRLPLPPYIQREPTAEDERRYQTVYADREGERGRADGGTALHRGVARRASRGERRGGLARSRSGPRHVPTNGGRQREPTHDARGTIRHPGCARRCRRACRERGGNVWAVGTTVVRALESAARDDRTVASGTSETRLMITPGFRFRVVDRLITNFHLPRSTLLMLVASLPDTTRRWRRIGMRSSSGIGSIVMGMRCVFSPEPSNHEPRARSRPGPCA